MTWKTKILGVCAVAALAVMGCSKESDQASRAPEAKQSGAHSGSGHGQAGAVPGTHEDWCEEHGVAESQCTRCNPDLIAAFKATGDWCDEHGLPESQCLQCNPELKIVRPPRTEAR
jgi:hypothetical protein